MITSTICERARRGAKREISFRICAFPPLGKRFGRFSIINVLHSLGASFESI